MLLAIAWDVVYHVGILVSERGFRIRYQVFYSFLCLVCYLESMFSCDLVELWPEIRYILT